MTKYNIINRLNAIHGYKRFLEISTPSTGLAFDMIDRSSLELCHRYVYNSPNHHDDGKPTTFRSAHEVSHQMLRAIGASGSWRRPYELDFCRSIPYLQEQRGRSGRRFRSAGGWRGDGGT